MNRAPNDSGSKIMGSSTNMPFWPGGMDPPELDDLDWSVEEEFKSKCDISYPIHLCIIHPIYMYYISFLTRKSSQKFLLN